MTIYGYNSKKDKIMDKWGHLIQEKIKKRNIELDKFLTILIENGEKYYGHDFADDLYRENRNNTGFVDKFIDELTEQNGIESLEREDLQRRFARAVNSPLQGIVNAVSEMTTQKKEEEKKEEVKKALDVINAPQKLVNVINAVAAQKQNEEEKPASVSKNEIEDEKIESIEGKEDEKVSEEDSKQLSEDIFSGKYGDIVSLEEFGFEPDEPILKGKRKEPKPSLLTRVKEKFKDKSFRKKLLIGVAAIFIVSGVAIISQFTGAGDAMSVNGVVNGSMLPFADAIEQVTDIVNNTNGMDYSSITEGHIIYDDAYDAAANVNQLVANEWVGSVPHDVYDVVNHEYLNLTSEQLNNPEFMKELMSNGDYSLLVGDGTTPSGFISGEDVMNMIDSGRSI